MGASSLADLASSCGQHTHARTYIRLPPPPVRHPSPSIFPRFYLPAASSYHLLALTHGKINTHARANTYGHTNTQQDSQRPKSRRNSRASRQRDVAGPFDSACGSRVQMRGPGCLAEEGGGRPGGEGPVLLDPLRRDPRRSDRNNALTLGTPGRL